MFKKTLENQTEFAQEAPVLTEPDLAAIDPEIAAKVAARRRLVKRLMFFIGLSLVFVSGIIFLLFTLMPQKQPEKKTALPSPTPTPTKVDLSLLGQAQALKSQIKQNDPSEDVFYFPSVDQKIYLDEPQRH